MRLRWGWVGLAVLLQAPAAGAFCRAELEGRLAAIAQRPVLRSARLGILVETQAQDPAQRRTLYARDADQWFVPASNVKLLTTAAALQRLGADYRTRTAVYGSETNGLTTLHVVGRGDPTLQEAQLQDLAQQVAQQGVTRVSQLIGYDGYFPGPVVHPDWEWADIQYGYGAGVNALMVAENELVVRVRPQSVGQPLTIDWVTPPAANPWLVENVSQTAPAGSPSTVALGRNFSDPVFRLSGQLPADGDGETLSLAIHAPAEYFLGRLQQQLRAMGVQVAQTSVSDRAFSPAMQELAAVTSAPLSEWLKVTNQRSNNQFAEAILKTLGVVNEPESENAIASGTAAVQEILQPLGVDPSSYQLADGSGLSRHNLAAPRTFVDLLQAMATVPTAQTYRDSLAVAGESGTLRQRFSNTALAGRLVGKTGALSNTAALSGYLDPPNHPPVVLSILLNNSDPSGSDMRTTIDDLIEAIAQLDDC